MNSLMEAIRRAIEPRWNARLPGILARARSLVGKDPKDIYIQAWRDAYAAAVEDMVDSGLVNTTLTPVAPLGRQFTPISDEVH